MLFSPRALDRKLRLMKEAKKQLRRMAEKGHTCWSCDRAIDDGVDTCLHCGASQKPF